METSSSKVVTNKDLNRLPWTKMSDETISNLFNWNVIMKKPLESLKKNMIFFSILDGILGKDSIQRFPSSFHII